MSPTNSKAYTYHKSFPCFSLLLWVDPGAKVSCSPATQPQGGALAPLVLEPNPGSWSFLELAQLKEAETVEAGGGWGGGEGAGKALIKDGGLQIINPGAEPGCGQSCMEAVP